MNMIIRKRQILTATLVIALGAAIFVNWYYTRPEAAELTKEKPTETVSVADADNLGDAQYVFAGKESGSDVFDEAELNRQKAHDKAAEMLNDVIKDQSSSEEAVREATNELNRLSESLKLEADVQTLIEAKTGGRCLVMLNGESAEVILPNGVLNDVITVRIKDIIVNKTDISAEKITIVELNG